MPSGQAAEFRVAVAKLDATQFDLKKNPYSKTGYVGVIEVKGKFQARVQVPGDGRGGATGRKQHSVPGLFDTPAEAALMRAKVMYEMKKGHGGRIVVPPKQNKPHKPRSVQPRAVAELPQEPVRPEPLAVVAVTAVPVPCMVQNAPFVAVSPLPMQPLRFLLPL